MRAFAVFVVTLAIAAICYADTPANCMYEDIRGVWDFKMDAGGKSNTESCAGTLTSTQTYTVNLTFPNIAKGPNGEQGTWTMIYNQGFEVRISNRKFFAFSAYKEAANGKAVSYCSDTLNGWYHNNDQTNWGCYSGHKHGASVIREHDNRLRNHPDRLQKKFMNDHRFVEHINTVQSSWTATVYPEFEQFTVGQMERRAGTPRPSFEHMRTAEKDEHALLQAQRSVDEIMAGIPAAFDWRNVSGVNYVSPVRDQASCGSCYVFASCGALEARIRIQSKNVEQPILSTQDPVSCSEYSQGCDGGFPYLIAGKYAEDFGIVEEDCFPYTASDTPCSRRCTNPKRKWYSTDYNYIGGYYGATNEALMLEEIYKNGPIPVGFQVYSDFYNYHSGVYKHTKALSFNPFYEVNHAVLAVGWGVTEQGEKYWIVKNSWGASWGNQGYFWILRGANECGIETLSPAITPKI